ncbi:MAG: hypothetical protein IIA30_02020, partial [Myxococcales bacterium]|nr:hypothetical protein [Myxococcales bacterium]
KVVRPHFQAGGPVCSKLADARVRRMDIDFAESHGCLAETAAIRTPGVLKESLHNAQTLCCAAYNLKRNHGRRIVMEPTAVVSIVPISFGYDRPLAKNTDTAIREEVLPHVEEHLPQLAPLLTAWLAH